MKLSEVPRWIVEAVAEIHDIDMDDLAEEFDNGYFREDVEVITANYLRSLDDPRWRNLRIDNDLEKN